MIETIEEAKEYFSWLSPKMIESLYRYADTDKDFDTWLIDEANADYERNNSKHFVL